MSEALFADGGSYEAAELRKMIRSIFYATGNGAVIRGMAVTPGVGLNVTVGAGYFIVNDGSFGAFDGYVENAQTVSIDANVSGSTRVDTVYAAINATSGAVTFSKTTGGTSVPSGAIALAAVSVPNNAVSLVSGNIVNAANTVDMGGVSDARYLRKNGPDALYAGTTASAPTAAGHVANKAYVDNLTSFVDLFTNNHPPEDLGGGALWSTGADAGQINGRKFIMQAGSFIGSGTDNSGYARITFPKPFPNGLLTVIAMNGDYSAMNDVVISGAGLPWHVGLKTDWVYILSGPLGSYNNRGILRNYGRHRVNWIAIGW